MTEFSAQADIQTYREAARHNREEEHLQGATLQLPNYGQLVATGDLHGHRRNFERLQNYCDLAHAPTRHIVLHEIIHEEPQGLAGLDLSHEVLLAAARWKTEYPDQVHFLQSNHELAQLTEQDISKGGRIVTYSFLAGLRQTYGNASDDVADAVMEFLASYPLAIRTANRVLLTHSLPSPAVMGMFDPTVLSRQPTPADLRDGGSGYYLVWGRHQAADQLAELARTWDVDWFICGHQPQEFGYAVVHDRMIILASDHNHGVMLPFDLRREYDLKGLEESIRPLASVA
ncbi:MAG TPA: metallophosphoesterase [Phycisphaerae bacterium]|nr:metallophosphoesterase [Phycisphaerales bacterium]HRX87217.1 metallophosphoesterase [Phycisphaerae bacterium]